MDISSGSAVWHRASVKLLHNFLWARFIIVCLPDFVSGLETIGRRYTAGIVGCHLLGEYEAGYPQGVGVYFGLMVICWDLIGGLEE